MIDVCMYIKTIHTFFGKEQAILGEQASLEIFQEIICTHTCINTDL
jgi:hypothetical protein